MIGAEELRGGWVAQWCLFMLGLGWRSVSKVARGLLLVSHLVTAHVE
jgi:hypothetical protein